MPGGDRTGPMGMGPMIGRRAGYCFGFNTPGYSNPFPGRGFGMGRGRSRGFWRFGAGEPVGGGRGFSRWNMFNAGGYYRPPGYETPQGAPDPDAEKETLRNQVEALRSELEYVRKRLDEMETGTPAV